jgi:hypothetical protein
VLLDGLEGVALERDEHVLELLGEHFWGGKSRWLLGISQPQSKVVDAAKVDRHLELSSQERRHKSINIWFSQLSRKSSSPPSHVRQRSLCGPGGCGARFRSCLADHRDPPDQARLGRLPRLPPHLRPVHAPPSPDPRLGESPQSLAIMLCQTRSARHADVTLPHRAPRLTSAVHWWRLSAPEPLPALATSSCLRGPQVSLQTRC